MKPENEYDISNSVTQQSVLPYLTRLLDKREE